MTAPTPSDGRAMSDEQLRIAVAEAMGEIRVLNKKDYPNSRDACASFEATLDGLSQRASSNPADHKDWMYAGHLARICGIPCTQECNHPIGGPTSFKFATATPRQRCFAYLATVAPAKLK